MIHNTKYQRLKGMLSFSGHFWPNLCHWSHSLFPRNRKTPFYLNVFMEYRKRSLSWNGLSQKQRPKVFYEKGVLKNFSNFTRETPVLKSSLDKVAGLRLRLYYEETSIQVISCEIWEIFKKTYFEEYLRTTAFIKQMS